MGNVRWRALVAALVAGGAGWLRGAPLAAQEPGASGGETARRPRTVAVWTALGRDEPLWTRTGRTHERDLYLLGLRMATPVGGDDTLRLDYVLDFIPAIVMTGNPLYEVRRSTRPRSVGWALARTQTVYGAGIAPIGLQIRAALGRHVALLARTSGGGALFTHPVPDPDGTRFNFTVDLSTALELRLTRTLGASAGFRLHHLSNAGTGRLNPGMNTRMLEFGVTRLPR